MDRRTNGANHVLIEGFCWGTCFVTPQCDYGDRSHTNLTFPLLTRHGGSTLSGFVLEAQRAITSRVGVRPMRATVDVSREPSLQKLTTAPCNGID